jgi:hypothetical protein
MDVPYLTNSVCSGENKVQQIIHSTRFNYSPIFALPIHLGVEITVIENDRIGTC